MIAVLLIEQRDGVQPRSRCAGDLPVRHEVSLRGISLLVYFFALLAAAVARLWRQWTFTWTMEFRSSTSMLWDLGVTGGSDWSSQEGHLSRLVTWLQPKLFQCFRNSRTRVHPSRWTLQCWQASSLFVLTTDRRQSRFLGARRQENKLMSLRHCATTNQRHVLLSRWRHVCCCVCKPDDEKTAATASWNCQQRSKWANSGEKTSTVSRLMRCWRHLANIYKTSGASFVVLCSICCMILVIVFFHWAMSHVWQRLK